VQDGSSRSTLACCCVFFLLCSRTIHSKPLLSRAPLTSETQGLRTTYRLTQQTCSPYNTVSFLWLHSPASNTPTTILSSRFAQAVSTNLRRRRPSILLATARATTSLTLTDDGLTISREPCAHRHFLLRLPSHRLSAKPCVGLTDS
jgi:hypothetical protein